jgi:excisionase family DNA binding protein
MDDAGDLLTVREVAKQLRVDDTTVRRWIKTGVLEAITLPHSGRRQTYRIRRSTLNALLAQPGHAATATDAGANAHGREAPV